MNPIFVALDTSDRAAARALVGALRDRIGGVKLGLEYFSALGPAGVAEIGSLGVPIFLDLKLHDIPNTVAKAMASLRPLEPAIVTVHATGGRAMMESAKAAAPTGCKVVGVTVLTSLDGPDLAETGCAGGVDGQVDRLAALARESGLDGVVCSGLEVGRLRKSWPNGFFVVPGIRTDDGAAHDQKRVVTAQTARDAGASVLVIGRAITAAEDPAAAARAIAESL